MFPFGRYTATPAPPYASGSIDHTAVSPARARREERENTHASQLSSLPQSSQCPPRYSQMLAQMSRRIAVSISTSPSIPSVTGESCDSPVSTSSNRRKFQWKALPIQEDFADMNVGAGKKPQEEHVVVVCQMARTHCKFVEFMSVPHPVLEPDGPPAWMEYYRHASTVQKAKS